MSNPIKLFLSSLLFSIFYFSATSVASASDFANPVLQTPTAGCAAENLQARRFAAEISQNERLKICLALDKISGKLKTTAWSASLSSELENIWQAFSSENVTLRLMPKGTSSRMLAMAEAFPSGNRGADFEACVYVRPEKSDKASFFQVLLHELRHVYDFHETWKNKTALDSLELERRAFLLMSKLTEETPQKGSLSGIPKFWKESWRNRSAEEIAAKRNAVIEKYLRRNKFYRNLAEDNTKQALDFSYLNGAAQSETQPAAEKFDKKEGEPLPVRPMLPQTVAVLPQNIRELNFDLEKPKNPRDEKEILRVAFDNEKKLYYGMSNFVYDQKLEFQCWRKGRVSASFAENNTLARTENGNVLFQQISARPASPCTLDNKNLKTDFTETFWASPALEKMPVNFVGFVEVDGKTLARYTVLQPDAKLFEQLANEFPNIKPFRVFVGTIFVSPEDGQIVRFWGTSFPEDNVTGSNSKKVWGSYSVNALRQKLDIDSGLWVTVYVGTVAVANVGGNFHPFSYTVKFENYRQSKTDVRILDNEITAGNSSVSRN